MAYEEGQGETKSVSRDEFHWQPLIVTATATETSPAAEVHGCRNITIVCKADTWTDNTGIFTFEVSPDNSNWHVIDWVYAVGGTDVPVANVTFSAAGTEFIQIPHATAYIRVKVTVTDTAGTYSAILMAN